MPELTVFINVFFRNEKDVLDYYKSVRSLIGKHKAVFLINNISEDFSVTELSNVAEIIYVEKILENNLLNGVDKIIRSNNSRYLKHFFAGVTCCNTEYFTFLDPDNICKDYSWIEDSEKYFIANKSVIAACPYWGVSGESPNVFYDSSFSDQLFIGVTTAFKNFDYARDSIYGWRFPLRQNGATFESAVFANMYTENLRRVVLCRFSYSHLNEGNSYARRDLFNDTRRFLGRVAWNIRSKIRKDKQYG